MVVLTQGVVFAAGAITDKEVQAGLAACKDFPVNLMVDGQPVTFGEKDVPPVVITPAGEEKGRTLVPARSMFEAMGAAVSWDEPTQTVTVLLGESVVNLTINSDKALVNGVEKILEVPALIIDHDGDYFGSTMIPVRFTAEELGCGVAWDEASRTANVTAPASSGGNNTTGSGINTTGSGINTTGSGITSEEPDNEMPGWLGGTGVSDVTSGGSVTTSGTGIDSGTIATPGGSSQGNSGQNSLFPFYDMSTLPVMNEAAQKELIVFDLGHGGKDSGSIGHKDLPDQLYEKDLNLPIGLRIKELLDAAGANTYFIRETDIYFTLLERAAAANSRNATLFVSIHNNSNDYPAPNGTEVLYYSKIDAGGNSEQALYGIDSKSVAQRVQKEMVTALGTYDRGVKSSPKMAVLNKTFMPAIIIEGAFLSNEGDFAKMKTDEYIERYAYAAAKAIIESMNDAFN